MGTGAISLGSLAVGCTKRTPSTALDFHGRTLTVFVYSGLDKIFQEHFVEPFEAKTGATVVLDAGWWDSIGKLKSSPKGQPAYDLVLTDATQGYPAIKSGMFRQLDFDKIPNHRQLAPVALDNWIAKERYGVTFHESAMTCVWDRRQLAFEPGGWGDLMRPELKGKLSLYDSFYMSLYTFACMKVATDDKPGTAHKAMAHDLDGVLDFAKRERIREPRSLALLGEAFLDFLPQEQAFQPVCNVQRPRCSTRVRRQCEQRRGSAIRRRRAGGERQRLADLRRSPLPAIA